MRTDGCNCRCHGMSSRWATCSIEGGCGHLHSHQPEVRLDTLGQCLLCRYPRRRDGTLCWRHHDAIDHMLNPLYEGQPDADIPASIPVLYVLLDPTPGGGGNHDRRPPGFHSAPAASLHKLVMRDDRSVNNPQEWYGAGPDGEPDFTRPYLEDDNPPRAIRKALASLAESLVEQFNLPGPRLPDGAFFDPGDVTGLCGWLYLHLHAITNLPDADDIHDDLLDLSDQLRPAVGDHKLGPAGWCIELVRDKASREYRECGAALYLPPPVRDPEDQTPEQAQQEVIVTCRRCRRPYNWLDLLRLRLVDQPA